MRFWNCSGLIEFGEDEAVWCPPGLDHWHGATPEAPMTHLVMTGSRDGENAVWKEKVSDEVYYGSRQTRDQNQSSIDSLLAKQHGEKS